MCTHTIFPGSSKLGVISSVCSTAVSVSWSWKEKSKNRKCVPLADLFNLLLWVGWNGLPPTHDTLHLGYSYHLHSSHRFLSTWGAVRLIQQKKKQKKNKKQKRTLIVPATCLPSNQLRKYTPILLIAHKLSNAKSRYLLLASFPAPCWACCRLQHQVRLGNEASCISWKCPAQTADSLEQGHSLAMCLGSKPARLQFQHSWFGSTPIIT